MTSMKTSQHITQSNNTKMISIFDDRRKHKKSHNITVSQLAQDRRKSQFNYGNAWYLKASIS